MAATCASPRAVQKRSQTEQPQPRPQSRLMAYSAVPTLARSAGLAGSHECGAEGGPEARADGAAAAAEPGAAGQAADRAQRRADRRRSRAAADSWQVCHASLGSPLTGRSKPDMV